MGAVLITGVSRGLGEALARHYLTNGDEVAGIARNAPEISSPRFTFCAADLRVHCNLADSLSDFLAALPPLDLVVLNAGILGPVAPLPEIPYTTIRQVMDINVWGNKVLLDLLFALPAPPGQVIAISSGAAVNGSAGWGPYSISKAALNLLIRVSAHEHPECHMCALAPGLVGTEMLGGILDAPPRPEFDADTRLRQAQAEGRVQTPAAVAARIAGIVEKLRKTPTGGFLDIRQLPF